MVEIEFEEPELSVCGCCGKTITRLTRFVTRDGDAYAVYYVEFTEGHDHRRADVMVGLGEWGDDTVVPEEARVAFTFKIWLGEESYQVSMIDPDDSPWTTRFLGRRISRADALKHPALQEVFDLSDHIARCDKPLIGFLNPIA
jgi:hypothetical protein